MRRTVLVSVLAATAALGVLHAQRSAPQQPASSAGAAGDWPTYNRDPGATRYSPLTQINTSNVAQLAPAWTFKLPQRARAMTGGWEFTPIVVNGMMYVVTNDSVVGLEADTGKEIWTRLIASLPSRRAVAFWPGGPGIRSRVYVTSSKRLIALDALTGESPSAFGKSGEIEMAVNYESAPGVYKNLLIAGSNGNPGGTYAYDANTGAKVWEFRSIPQAGEPGTDSWDGETWKNKPGGNHWGFSQTIDAERGIVFATYDSPGPNDYYGGDRPGNNLFASSVVALDANSGKMKWHFQLTHHDLWDYDVPPPPTLLDITIGGRTIPAVAVMNKAAYMFILDRVTGKPVFGVEERPVPQSDVPGERSSPTQPFPVKPPALARTSYKPEDLVTANETNEAHANWCKQAVERSGGVYNAGPYTNYLYRAPGAPPRSTVLFPGSIGGPNWGGAATDPSLGYIFVNTSDEASIGWIEPTEAGQGNGYRRNSIFGPTSRFQMAEGNPRVGNVDNAGSRAWPCQKPPWGQLFAVNASTGDIAWKIVLGVTDDLPEGKRNTGG